MAASTKAMASVGSSMYISMSLPTAETVEGYKTLTYTEIGELDSIPEYGPESEEITRTPLKKNIVDKGKGARNMGSGAAEMAWAPGDAGQALLIQAEKQPGAVSIKVELPDGTLEYYQALVLSYKRTPGAAGDWLTATAQLSIKSEIITDYPA